MQTTPRAWPIRRSLPVTTASAPRWREESRRPRAHSYRGCRSRASRPARRWRIARAESTSIVQQPVRLVKPTGDVDRLRATKHAVDVFLPGNGDVLQQSSALHPGIAPVPAGSDTDHFLPVLRSGTALFTRSGSAATATTFLGAASPVEAEQQGPARRGGGVQRVRLAVLVGAERDFRGRRQLAARAIVVPPCRRRRGGGPPAVHARSPHHRLQAYGAALGRTSRSRGIQSLAARSS